MVTRRSAGAASDNLWCGLAPGAKVLVDTAPIIYLLQDHPALAPRFAGLFEAEARGELAIAISAVTLAEVLVGPDGHFKFPHLWPLKLPQAGRSDYGFPAPVWVDREAAIPGAA